MKDLVTKHEIDRFVVTRDGMMVVFDAGELDPEYEPGVIERVDWKSLRALADDAAVIDRWQAATKSAHALAVASTDELSNACER